MTDNIVLIIVSLIAGVWNVLNEAFFSIKRSICLFILGVSFCYAPAVIMADLGYSSAEATVVGYFCGVLSVKLYDVAIRCLNYIPDIFLKRLGGERNDRRTNSDTEIDDTRGA